MLLHRCELSRLDRSEKGDLLRLCDCKVPDLAKVGLLSVKDSADTSTSRDAICRVST
ncbi:MAG: hypothetical protein KME26_25195 [Oscillatoria princeps RMCB-10]|nr:hypothetical protein [Oscillatoria princeps RMCB-10]